jgi:hypothetical protein
MPEKPAWRERVRPLFRLPAAPGWLVALWHPAHWCLDKVSDFDTIRGHAGTVVIMISAAWHLLTGTAWGYAISLVAGFGWLGWLVLREQPPIEAGKPQLRLAIQEPRSGRVPRFKRVRGIVHPQAPFVQVFVLAGSPTDKWWYPQGESAAIDGFEWQCPSVFGNGKNLTGTVFEFCAIAPGQPVTNRRIKDLPVDAIKSEVVAVTLDYGLTDDWSPTQP